MIKIFAVYLESLDQELKVFEDEAKAKAYYEELKAAGKPVAVQVFDDYQIISVYKANGEAASSPEFWEEVTYDNGTCKLVANYKWHQEPEPEGYYAEYILNWL